MESLVYENSPLADYLQGEGENGYSWPLDPMDKEDGGQSGESTSNFAPRGASKFQQRIRNKLPKPLDLQVARQSEAIGRIYDACASALNARVGQSDNERFLEQFGYVIVASQLLNEHSAPSYTSAADVLSHAPQADLPSLSTTFGLQGAIVTASTSFSIAWLLHWTRPRSGSGLNPKKVGILMILVPVLGVLFYAFAKRQWLKYLRHQAVDAAVTFISNAQGFDSAASGSVVFIQEVELVSRGYRISTPLPPVSRLEDQAQIRRCLRLRRTVSECLYSLLARYLQAQRSLQPLTDDINLAKYYDIYDVSVEELIEAEACLAERETDDQYSLRALRTLFGRLYGVRKSILCCLLALGADGGGSDIERWSTAVELMRKLGEVTGQNIRRMTDILSEEDSSEIIPPSPLPTASSPNKDAVRTQFRRLNALSQGIRALHAKMHVVREEANSNVDRVDTSEMESRLLTQYDSIGTDIRSLLQEWEAGKNALVTSFDRQSYTDRSSRPPSTLVPMSPTSSLGGVTAVEGSPMDALKALTGENSLPEIMGSPSTDTVEEDEIFEAVALPSRSSKRSSLSRGERIARVKEDRAKQAAARDRTDANTNMLRELEMVIKQRPQINTAPKRVTISREVNPTPASGTNYPKGRSNQRQRDSFTRASPSPPTANYSSLDSAFITSSSAIYLPIKMLEARLEQASLLKRVADAIKDLVQDCNFDCNDSGIALQAMDNSHVALVSMLLRAEGFSPYRCDRNIALGINLISLTKVLRAAQNEDVLTLKADDTPDAVNLMFESPETDRISEYDIKLMDIDQEHLAIPETEYAATVEMPSAEFQRICRDLNQLSESVVIEATKEGVKFSCQGDIGSGSVTIRQHTNVERPEQNVSIALSEPVALTFSLKYLVNFCKATNLSTSVSLCLSQEVPLLVQYGLGSGHLRFYLAPKIGDEE